MVIEDFLSLKSVTSRSENLKSRVTKVTGIFYFIFFFTEMGIIQGYFIKKERL